MSNQQLIKSAHISFLVLLLACGLWAVAGKAGTQDQYSNQNSNSNANSSRSQNRNANRSANRNMGATGEQTGMANMSAQDRDFLMDAAMGGMMEVELGRVAAQQAASVGVKQFLIVAARMRRQISATQNIARGGTSRVLAWATD